MRPVFRIGTIGADHHSCRYRGKTCDPLGAAGSAGVDPLRRRCRLRRRQQVQGHLTRLTTGTLSLDIDEPETLKGMTMQWDGETVSVKMYGLSFGLDPAAVPETALGRSLLAALDAALHPSGEGKVTENGLVTNGEAAGGAFTITSDPETGSLLSLELPSAQLKATFTNFALKTT